ncbi:MAG TPA: hypothetical protein VN843_06795 [Anaerolineales bacterium]|nr:hypothetical protein [Anaerolineales bacterium]
MTKQAGVEKTPKLVEDKSVKERVVKKHLVPPDAEPLTVSSVTDTKTSKKEKAKVTPQTDVESKKIANKIERSIKRKGPKKRGTKSKVPTKTEIAGLFSPKREPSKPQVVKAPKDTVVDGISIKKGETVMIIPAPKTTVEVTRSIKDSEEEISATSSEKSSFVSPGTLVTSDDVITSKSTSTDKIPLSTVVNSLRRLTAGYQRNFPVFKTRG